MRSKQEVFQEHFGVNTHKEALNEHDLDACPRGPLSNFTKLPLPYEAPNHPGIPTVEEIQAAMKTENRLSVFSSMRDVCIVGNTVVKMDYTVDLIQVSNSFPPA